jgi:hypothetical protein
MRHLRKRLERLESRLTDSSGCVPYSKEWFLYWAEPADRLLSGDREVPPAPIAFWDAVLADEERPRYVPTSTEEGRKLAE